MLNSDHSYIEMEYDFEEQPIPIPASYSSSSSLSEARHSPADDQGAQRQKNAFITEDENEMNNLDQA